MIGPLSRLSAFSRNTEGAVVIETAIVLPVLILLALGSFEASRIVSRQSELQSAVGEATAVVIAAPPEDQTDIDQIEAIVEASTGLTGNGVRLVKRYKCDSDPALTTDSSACSAGAVISEYIVIRIEETYSPMWTQFGFGSDVNFEVRRRVQIS